MKLVIKIVLFYHYDIYISYSNHAVLNETSTEIRRIFNRKVSYFKQARVFVVSKVSLLQESQNSVSYKLVCYKKYKRVSQQTSTFQLLLNRDRFRGVVNIYDRTFSRYLLSQKFPSYTCRISNKSIGFVSIRIKNIRTLTTEIYKSKKKFVENRLT